MQLASAGISGGLVLVLQTYMELLFWLNFFLTKCPHPLPEQKWNDGAQLFY